MKDQKKPRILDYLWLGTLWIGIGWTLKYLYGRSDDYLAGQFVAYFILLYVFTTLVALWELSKRFGDNGERRPRQNYGEYLQSQSWKNRRDAAVRRAGYMCQECGSSSRLEVHHLTYERIGNERDADLKVLCRRCHAERHGTPID